MSDIVANIQLISAIENAWEYKFPNSKIDAALRKGADVNWCSNEKDTDGQTALLMAINKFDSDENLYEEICKRLIRLKADVNKATNEGMTPLMLAVEHGAVNITKLLLENDANIDAQDDQGRTALLRAINNGMDDDVELLIEHGANVTIVDKYGSTAITLTENWDEPLKTKIREAVNPINKPNKAPAKKLAVTKGARKPAAEPKKKTAVKKAPAKKVNKETI